MTVEMLTINLNERGYDCAMCGAHGNHRHAVSVDDCGEPTARETGAGRVVCKPCHDTLHQPRMEDHCRMMHEWETRL